MRATFKLFYLLAFLFSLSSCFNNDTTTKKQAISGQPDFLDNGKTIDGLKVAFNCESIDYENWGNKKVTDSCLTVCLINSTKVPSGGNMDNEVIQLKEIASSIKKSLTAPQNYKSFYIIFVKKENVNGEETKTHSAGMEIPSAEL